MKKQDEVQILETKDQRSRDILEGRTPQEPPAIVFAPYKDGRREFQAPPVPARKPQKQDEKYENT